MHNPPPSHIDWKGGISDLFLNIGEMTCFSVKQLFKHIYIRKFIRSGVSADSSNTYLIAKHKAKILEKVLVYFGASPNTGNLENSISNFKLSTLGVNSFIQHPPKKATGEFG